MISWIALTGKAIFQATETLTVYATCNTRQSQKEFEVSTGSGSDRVDSENGFINDVGKISVGPTGLIFFL